MENDRAFCHQSRGRRQFFFVLVSVMNAKRAALFIYGKLGKEIYSQIWEIEKFRPRGKFDRNQAEGKFGGCSNIDGTEQK